MKINALNVWQHHAAGLFARWLVVACLLVPSLTYAQEARPEAQRDISGYVRDGETGEALPHASVLLAGTKRGAATNTDGYFVIVNAPVGSRKLRVSYIGYATGEVELDSTAAAGNAPLNIYLTQIVYELEGITVQGEAQTIEVAGKVSEVVLAPAQLRSMPNIGEVDVFRSLQLLPGISGASDGSSGLYVRGGTPDQNLVLFDGMTIYHVDHFFGMFSAFNADAIKDIRVYKGGYPAEFGGRISSVVDLTGKTGSSSDYRYGVGLNLLSGNGLLEIPLHEKGSLLLSLRRSYTDVVQSSLYNKLFDFKAGDDAVQTADGPGGGGGGGRGGGRFASVSERPEFYFYDFNTKLTLTPTDKDIFSLSFYRGKDNLDQSQDLSGNNFAFMGNNSDFVVGQDISRQREELTTWGNTGVSGKWSRRFHDRLYSSAMASYSSYFSTYDRSTGFSGSTLADSAGFFRGGGAATNEDNEVEDLTIRLDNEFHVSNSHDLKFGLGVSMFNSHYFTALNDTTQLLALETESRQANFYLQDLWSIGSNLELTVGGRGVHYDKTSELYFEPRASMLYSLSQRIKLKGAWGQYHQFVNRIANENVLEGGRDFWILADEELAPNFAEHYIAGVSYETDDFLFDVEGYYKDLEDLLEYTRRVQYVFRDGRREEVERGFFQGDGFAKGLDVLLQKKSGKLNGWLGYSLGQVEHTFPDLNGGQAFSASHDRTHEFNLVGKYRLGDWELAATFVYATGKAYTAPISQYYVDLLDGSEFSYIHVSDKNSQRLPNYHRLDFSVSRTFFTNSAKWVAGLSVFNLYNNKNVWYRQFDLDVQPVVVTDVTMLGFTPTVFVQIYSR